MYIYIYTYIISPLDPTMTTFSDAVPKHNGRPNAGFPEPIDQQEHCSGSILVSAVKRKRNDTKYQLYINYTQSTIYQQYINYIQLYIYINYISKF